MMRKTVQLIFSFCCTSLLLSCNNKTNPATAKSTLTKLEESVQKKHMQTAKEIAPILSKAQFEFEDSSDQIISENKKNKSLLKFVVDLNLLVPILHIKWFPYCTQNTQANTYVLHKKNMEQKLNTGDYRQEPVLKLAGFTVENVGGYMLKIIRKNICARFGYFFKNKEIRKHFEQFVWYIPSPIGLAVHKLWNDKEVKDTAPIDAYEDYIVQFGQS